MRSVDDWQVLVGRATSAITQRANTSQTEPSSGETLDGLLFFGNPHETVPRALLLDPSLGAIDILGWQMIRLLSTSDRTTAFPTYDQLQPLLRTSPGKAASRGTVARVIAILRLTRWLSLCHKARHDTNGRIMGNVYALHDEPLSVEEATALDSTYFEYVEHCLSHGNSAVREAARQVIEDLQQEGGGQTVSRLNRRAQRFVEMADARLKNARAKPASAQFAERTRGENWVEKPGSPGEPGQFPNAELPSSPREPSGNTGVCGPVRAENWGSTVPVRIYKSTSTVQGNQVLYWDDALQMDAQARTELLPVLSHLGDADLAQMILDETAGRVQAGKARSAKGLLRSLINIALKGEFKVTQYAQMVRDIRAASMDVPDRQPDPVLPPEFRKRLPEVTPEQALASRNELLASLGLRR